MSKWADATNALFGRLTGSNLEKELAFWMENCIDVDIIDWHSPKKPVQNEQDRRFR